MFPRNRMALARRRPGAEGLCPVPLLRAAAPYRAGVEIMSYPARFAFYGTLRRGGGALERLGLAATLVHIGQCVIPGSLHTISWYPGLVPGAGRVAGDLYLVPDAATVALLDRFEGYDAADPAGSLYVRREIDLVEPSLTAWTYLWTGPVAAETHIASGDWLAHRSHEA
jgi:gamma-glutamylcyclotransferase (GGCT)/AIG2-like uncharacterized protein YtfP